MITNSELRREAIKGDCKSMCILAMRYFDGFTTRRSPEKGLELVKKAQRKKCPYAIYLLGYYYKHYAYSPKKEDKIKDLFTQANRELKELADKEDAFACYCVGMINRKNTDTASKKEVIRLFKIAANAGMTEAQYELGLIYMNDPKQAENAKTLIYQAANKGYHKAQKAMGDIYSYGKLGQTASPEVAYEFYNKAARNGNHVAMRIIGEKYLANGNKERAQYWIRKANSRKSIDL